MKPPPDGEHYYNQSRYQHLSPWLLSRRGQAAIKPGYVHVVNPLAPGRFAKFQSDWKSLNTNSVASRFHEILRQDVRPLHE